MRTAAQHGFASSMLLVSLLLLAQWTGFGLVLCVAGPDHIQVECLDALGCAPRASGKAGMSEAAAGGCGGCTDIPIETVSTWDPARRHPAAAPPAAAIALSMDNIAAPCSQRLPDSSTAPLPSGSFTISPLRC
jgi:hypothetical protein